MEEGHGDSTDFSPIAFPQDMQMETTHEPVRNNNPATIRADEDQMDQMVPSITSFLRDEESSMDLRNPSVDSRAEVPTTEAQMRNNTTGQTVTQAVRNININTNTLPQNITVRRRNSEDSTADSSNSSRGVVPVWSPSSTNYSDQFAGDDNGIGTSTSYLQRHQQPHQLMNWQRLPQTG